MNAPARKPQNPSSPRSEGANLSLLGPSDEGGARKRYPQGWRAGKPEEDPEKLKKWGVVSARPSEFLIHMRRGRVIHSGQGASCFKWPWDSVAVVPTTVQRLHFVADQVTSEKVGVQVTGLAVYRIADPLIAFRMLNFSFPERAQEKLEELLVEMFVGAARRLVANLTVESCLTKRKEGIAAELMREIAPVVAGEGRTDDATAQGWGVVIDTIEIQDVRVLSETVFGNMQAGFRNEQERKAREAELLRERSVKQQEAEAQRQIALSQVASDAEVRQRKQEAQEQAEVEALAARSRVEDARAKVEERKLQQDRSLQLAKLEADLEVKRRKAAADEAARLEALSAEARMEQAKVEAELARVRLEADAMQARHQAKMAQVGQEAAQVRAEAEVAQAKRLVAEAELAAYELELRRQQLSLELELWKSKSLRDIENTVSPEVVSLTVAQQLPMLAQAFSQKMGEVHVTAVDGANPFGYIAAAVEGVMGLARAAGLQVSDKKEE